VFWGFDGFGTLTAFFTLPLTSFHFFLPTDVNHDRQRIESDNQEASKKNIDFSTDCCGSSQPIERLAGEGKRLLFPTSGHYRGAALFSPDFCSLVCTPRFSLRKKGLVRHRVT
jgi:hypothetical protein